MRTTVSRIVAGDDGAGEELPELGFIEAAEQIAERRIEGEGGAVGFADRPLKSEDGREGLHLDEARGEAAAVFADETEVGGEEMRMRRSDRRRARVREWRRGSGRGIRDR